MFFGCEREKESQSELHKGIRTTLISEERAPDKALILKKKGSGGVGSGRS